MSETDEIVERLLRKRKLGSFYLDDVRALDQRIKSLEYALTRIAYVDPPDATWDGTPSEALEWAGKIAREALTEASSPAKESNA